MDPRQQQPQQGNEPGRRWAPGQNPFLTEPLSGADAQSQNGPGPASTNLPVQQPEVYNSPNLANIPYGAQPAPQPQGQVVSGGPVSPKSPKKLTGPNKIVLASIGGAIALVIIIIIVIVAISSGGEKKKEATDANPNTSPSLQPATALDLTQASNAISQDIGGLDDEKDFPSNSLDDKTLGL